MDLAKVDLAFPKMNSYERDFADELRLRTMAGELIWWEFEPLKFRIGDACWYTPDFVSVENDGTMTAYEVKGFWRDDARVKIKAAAARHPWIRFVAVTREKKAKGWKRERIRVR